MRSASPEERDGGVRGVDTGSAGGPAYGRQREGGGGNAGRCLLGAQPHGTAASSPASSIAPLAPAMPSRVRSAHAALLSTRKWRAWWPFCQCH
eukprot:scaffold23271_cov27-Tisochrysis_lutea.AAC.2